MSHTPSCSCHFSLQLPRRWVEKKLAMLKRPFFKSFLLHTHIHRRHAACKPDLTTPKQRCGEGWPEHQRSTLWESDWPAFGSDQRASTGFPGGAVVKNLPANAAACRDPGSIPGSGRSPGDGKGNPLQHSRLGNPVHRGGGWATAHEVTKSQTGLSHGPTRTNRYRLPPGSEILRQDGKLLTAAYVSLSHRAS